MNKILVANRGEIALRIMRTCKKMGISTLAIYSEADENAPFVKFADESICVGPPPSSKSYLMQDKIIKLALERNVEGIHPGYGFLSENADFAKKVTDAGIRFIGPKPYAIKVMGDKLEAKNAVKGYDIPMVPGVDHAIEDVESALQTAKEIGFPILIKAAAGGGGKGMRIVEREQDFKQQMDRAVSEAVSSFGNGAVFIEKYVGSPRHIEIQILADNHGNIVHLFERECSVQRRHQKVIEEAPSAVLSPELRERMGKAACDVAKACDYLGAGTVEFLYDNGNFYFLEMNTRLQVEHPVSELISGVDLVQEQIKIARGEKLSFSQNELTINGHSLEIRVYAENPKNDFLPDIGNLQVYKRPSGEGVRVDDALEEGMDIPIHYDPMIAKLIVHAENRNQAIAKMTKAIRDYDIVGVETTLDFCDFAINHPAFVSGDFDTHFVDKYFTNPSQQLSADDDSVDAAMAASYLFTSNKLNNDPYLPGNYSDWKLSR